MPENSNSSASESVEAVFDSFRSVKGAVTFRRVRYLFGFGAEAGQKRAERA